MEPTAGGRRTMADVLEPMTADECLGCAQLLRDVKPIVKTIRQREILDEFAQRFEASAAAKAGGTQQS